MLILFGARYDKWRVNYIPYFPRNSYCKEKYMNNYDIIIVSDPTMNLHGYNECCYGFYFFDLLKKESYITTYLSKIINNNNYENVYFYGSSIGGFASLYYGSKFKNSNIISINSILNPIEYVNDNLIQGKENIYHPLILNNLNNYKNNYYKDIVKNNCFITLFNIIEDEYIINKKNIFLQKLSNLF